jgi:hypothetical protein
MHPLFRTQTRPDPEQQRHDKNNNSRNTKTSAADPAGNSAMRGWTSRTPATTTPAVASHSSFETYESDSIDDDGTSSSSDSYEQATQDGTNTQYETDSAHSNSDTNSRDGWGSGSGSSHEKDDDNDNDNDDSGSGSDDGSRSSLSGSGSDNNSGSNDDGDDDDDDDDEFWNRYSGANDDDDDDDDDDDEDDKKGWKTIVGKKNGTESDDKTRDEFDDEFGFTDAAFPSVSANVPTSTSSKQKKRRLSSISGAKGMRMNCPGVSSLSCPKGKFNRRVLIGLALLILSAAVIIPLYLFVGKDKETPVAPPSEQAEIIPPSESQTSSPSSVSSALPDGEVEASIVYFGFVENGVEEGVTIEILENDLTAAFNELAPQILDELSENNDNMSITESKQESIGIRRILETVSVKVPVLVDVMELGKHLNALQVCLVGALVGC